MLSLNGGYFMGPFNTLKLDFFMYNFLVIIKKLLNDFYFYSYQQLGPKHSFPIYFLVCLVQHRRSTFLRRSRPVLIIKRNGITLQKMLLKSMVELLIMREGNNWLSPRPCKALSVFLLLACVLSATPLLLKS